MTIAGIQPFSLIDYPQKPCTVIFMQGCVFRCPYCHNPELLPLDTPSAKTTADVFSFLEERKNIIDAVCVSGGEPTLQNDLQEFIAELKNRGFFVKLDTNGIRPHVVEQLIVSRLVDYIAMDLKVPWEKYCAIIKTGTPQTVEACKKTFSFIQDSGIAHEFRTTILPGAHTREDFFTMVGYLRDGEQYFVQQTSFKKTLEPLDVSASIDVASLAAELKEAFPNITIEHR